MNKICDITVITAKTDDSDLKHFQAIHHSFATIINCEIRQRKHFVKD